MFVAILIAQALALIITLALKREFRLYNYEAFALFAVASVVFDMLAVLIALSQPQG